MRLTGIQHGIAPSHPHVATLKVDPMDCGRFQNAFEDDPAVRIITIDQSEADTWTIYVGCASRAVQDALEGGW